MAVGQGALVGGLSYLAIGRETTYGTYNTCTAALDFVSCGMKLSKEHKVIEQIERSRTYSKGISLSTVVEGGIEFYFSPRVDACNYLLQNAFGGAISSATATGETVGGAAMTHTVAIGAMDGSYTSLCINMRKGDATGGKIFEYSGLRVDEFNLSAEIDDALKCSTSLIGKDATNTANSVESALTISSAPVLSFVDGRLSIEGTFASLTSSSYWHVQSFEFALKNNLNGDNDSRIIGSSTLEVLPPGMATMELKCKLRFDTLTAWSAMRNATQFSGQLMFQGPTMTGSAIRQAVRLDFPVLYVKEAGDPEVGDASGILTSEVVFNVLRDDSSAAGYAVKALVTNNTQSYT